MPYRDPDRRREYQRRYYTTEEQREKRRPVWRKYAASSKGRERHREARVRKRLRIFERDGFRCAYCRRVFLFEELTIDHKIPSSRNGDDSPENLVTCCWDCNRRKGAKTYDAYLALIRPDDPPAWVVDEFPGDSEKKSV